MYLLSEGTDPCVPIQRVYCSDVSGAQLEVKDIKIFLKSVFVRRFRDWYRAMLNL
jgi:hypothetical protein